MPITIAKFKCKECKDVFDATSEEWAKCECGACELKPSDFSTSYRGGQGVKFNTLESNTYYYEDEFLKFDDELNELYNTAKELSDDLGISSYEYYGDGIDNEKYMESISFSGAALNGRYSITENFIRFDIQLRRRYNSTILEDIKDRFVEYINFLRQLKGEDISLNNRKSLIDYSESHDVEWEREQIEEYNYTFHF